MKFCAENTSTESEETDVAALNEADEKFQEVDIEDDDDDSDGADRGADMGAEVNEDSDGDEENEAVEKGDDNEQSDEEGTTEDMQVGKEVVEMCTLIWTQWICPYKVS